MTALISFATSDGSQLDLRVLRHPLSIGRAVDNAVRSPERTVSRHHAVIARLDDGSFELQDVGSSYGTFVNGTQVQRHALRTDDELRMGDLVLRFALVPALAGDELDSASSASRASDGGADAVALAEVRERVEQLLEQQSDLRREVSSAQREEETAQKERDELETELKRVRADLERQRNLAEGFEAKVAKLDAELKKAAPAATAGGADVAGLQQQLRQAKNLADTLQKQIATMEERDSQFLGMKKENTRLTEELRQTRDRMASAQESVGPAMARIEALGNEVKDLKKKLTFTEDQLEEARRKR